MSSSGIWSAFFRAACALLSASIIEPLARVGAGEDLAEVLDIHRGVERRGFQAAVPEQLLDVAHVRLPLEEMGAVAVAQGVGKDGAGDPGRPGVVLDQAGESAGSEPPAPAGEEERRLARALEKLGSALSEVEVEGGRGAARERH